MESYRRSPGHRRAVGPQSIVLQRRLAWFRVGADAGETEAAEEGRGVTRPLH